MRRTIEDGRARFVPWRIRHVDLTAPRDSWRLQGDGEGIYVVFWAGDIPLGHEWLDRRALPLEPPQVAELAARVVTPAVGWWTIGRHFSPTYPSSDAFNAARRDSPDRGLVESLQRPLQRAIALADDAAPARRDRVPPPVTLSVVVCTRERPDSLAPCLAALSRSGEAADEIIVVDNAPRTEATREVVERFAGVRYVEQPVPGLSAARNAGVAASRGDIVAFTDDDVEVHHRWTHWVRQALADGSYSAMTGLVLPASLAEESEYLFEAKFGGFSQGYRPMVFDRDFFESTVAWGAPVWRLGAGANMAFRRETLARTGGFDERLGAGRAGCSEDSELWYRILKEGGSCTYDPRAVVFHRHRASMGTLRTQMHAYTRGHAAALLAQFERSGDWGNLKRLAISLPKYYLGRLIGRLTTVSPRLPSTYVDEVTGTLAGIGYYLRHRGARASSPRVAAAAEE